MSATAADIANFPAIRTAEDFRAWCVLWAEADFAMHPDTRASEYVNRWTREPSFTEADCSKVDALWDQVFEVLVDTDNLEDPRNMWRIIEDVEATVRKDYYL